jgi:NTP pyrophosphatase (non-canonical NTP hydrolase)
MTLQETQRRALAGVRHIPDLEEKLAHELADCLWSVLVLANHLGVNLDAAFQASMSELEANLRQRLDA